MRPLAFLTATRVCERVSSRRNASSRKFTGADGQDYRWTLHADGEWQVSGRCVTFSGSVANDFGARQCTIARNGYHVATYSMKPAGEPHYARSSGCMLTVEESYPNLIGGTFHNASPPFHLLIKYRFIELLASLIIMRHILQHNL